MLGINNRDLSDFSVDIERTFDAAGRRARGQDRRLGVRLLHPRAARRARARRRRRRADRRDADARAGHRGRLPRADGRRRSFDQGQDLRHHAPRGRRARGRRSAPGRSGSSSGRRPSAASTPAWRRGIARAVRRRVETVGVFVNQPLDEIAALVDALGLTHVQLHGDEGPSFCTAVAQRTGREGDQGRARRPRVRPAGRSSASTRDFHLLDTAAAGQLRRHRAHVGLGAARPAPRPKVPFLLSGGLTRGQRRGGDRRRAAVGRRRRLRASRPSPGVKDPAKLEAFFGRASRPRVHVGASSTASAPTAASTCRRRWCRRWPSSRPRGSPRATTPASSASSTRCCKDYVGRPSPLYLAGAAVRGRRPRRLPQARGPQPHRRAQDQQRARPVPAGQAHGQARASSPRPARASTASRPPPRARCSGSSASSTWAPRTCAASSPTCCAWSCWARKWRRSTPARATLKEAIIGRDPRLGDERRRPRTTCSAPCAGPAPYPALVRDLQRVIGDEARAQILEAGRPAARPRDRLRRRRLERDRHLHRLRRRRRRRARRRRGRGRGARDRPPRRAAHRSAAAAACCTAPSRRSCRTRTARSSRRTRSRPASTIPASAPSTRGCATAAAPRYVAVTDADALAAFRRLAELEGIIPALESAHAIAWVLGAGRAEPARTRSTSSACPAAATRTWPRRSTSSRHRRSTETRRATRHRAPAVRRAAARGRAALMPYLMGGFPDVETSVAVGVAYADAGADLVELGVPFSDPLADGPVIHAAATRALAAGRDRARRARGRRADRRARPGRAHVLREPDLRARARALRRRARRRAASAG